MIHSYAVVKTRFASNNKHRRLVFKTKSDAEHSLIKGFEVLKMLDTEMHLNYTGSTGRSFRDCTGDGLAIHGDVAGMFMLPFLKDLNYDRKRHTSYRVRG